jgi:hypothetical protein
MNGLWTSLACPVVSPPPRHLLQFPIRELVSAIPSTHKRMKVGSKCRHLNEELVCFTGMFPGGGLMNRRRIAVQR